MSEHKGKTLQAEITPVKNLDRKFGQVGEEEGYVRVSPEEGSALLFTHSEWKKAKERAKKNPEDVFEAEDIKTWLQELFD